MQLNFWLLPDILFPYLSTKLHPITYSRAVTTPTFLPIPLSKNPDKKCDASSAQGHAWPIGYFWLLEGTPSEKPPAAGEMPAITNHSVFGEACDVTKILDQGWGLSRNKDNTCKKTTKHDQRSLNKQNCSWIPMRSILQKVCTQAPYQREGLGGRLSLKLWNPWRKLVFHWSWCLLAWSNQSLQIPNFCMLQCFEFTSNVCALLPFYESHFPTLLCQKQKKTHFILILFGWYPSS